MKKNRGFTLIEVMVVIIIIGILVSIGVPRLIEAQDRAKYASLKMNMAMLRTGVELYSLDWNGFYPGNKNELYNESKNKKYFRDIRNPFNNYVDSVKDITDITTNSDFSPGTLAYGGNKSATSTVFPFFSTPDRGTYAIYAADKDMNPLKVSREIFYLSNDH